MADHSGKCFGVERLQPTDEGKISQDLIHGRIVLRLDDDVSLRWKIVVVFRTYF